MNVAKKANCLGCSNSLNIHSSLYYKDRKQTCQSFIHWQSLNRKGQYKPINKPEQLVNTYSRVHEGMTNSLAVNEYKTRCLNYTYFPCEQNVFDCYNINDICIYRLSQLFYIVPCKTGSHLQDCTQFECNMHYKCPGYYCIPWHYICDGKWDCPLGYDEHRNNFCSEFRNCHGMFVCHDTNICLHVKDVCDGYIDCPHQDDEILCELSVSHCPKYCICVNFAVSCKNITITPRNWNNLPYISVHITKSKIGSATFLFKIPNLKILNITFNSINSICDDLFQAKDILVIDLSFNYVREITSNCFYDLYFLTNVNLRNNNLSILKIKSFNNILSSFSINFSDNNLTYLLKVTFHNICKLHILVLFNNPFSSLDISVFNNIVINYLLTHEYHICCKTQMDVVCPLVKSWFNSCSSLIPSVALRIYFICVSLMILSSNFVSLSFNFKNIHKNYFQISRHKNAKPYNIIVFAINMTDILLGIYLLVMWSTDFYYGSMFALKYDQWKNNLLCFFSFMLLSTFNILLPFLLSFLAVSRYMVIKYPFDSKFKSTKFIIKCLTALMTTIITLTVGYTIIFNTYHSCTSSLCSPFIDPTDSLPHFKVFTIFVLIIQLVSIGCITYMYHRIPQLLKESKRATGGERSVNITMLIQFVLFSVNNVICWIPSSVIHLTCLILVQYPTDVLFWTTVVISPINSILNPVILMTSQK